MSRKAKRSVGKKFAGRYQPPAPTTAELMAEARKPPKGERIHMIADTFNLDPLAIKRAIEQGRITDRDGLIRRGKQYRLDSMTFECSAGRGWLGVESAIRFDQGRPRGSYRERLAKGD